MVTGFSSPQITAGFHLGLRARLGDFSIAVEGRGDLPGRLTVEGGQISTALLLGNALGCFHYEAFGGCVSASLGALRADAEALMNAMNTTSFYASINARGLYELLLSERFSVMLHIELSAVLTRIELINTTTQEPFWTTPAAHGNIGLSGSFTFY